jgi:hypothetical protein
MSSCIAFNMGVMQLKPMTTSTSHKNWRLVLIVSSMEIVIHFDDWRLILCKNPFSCVLTTNNIKLINFPWFPTIVKTFTTHGASSVKRKNKSIWFIKDYKLWLKDCSKSAYITSFIQCTTHWITSMKGVSLFQICVVTPIINTYKHIDTIKTKKTNLLLISFIVKLP